MNKIRMKANQRGFSLIELLISLALLTIGLLATVSMQGTAINKNGFANSHTAATVIAQQVMDDLLSVPIYRDPPNFWYTRFSTATGTTYDYERFPPFDGQTNNTATTSYFVPGVGTLSATYKITLNSPTTNITQIDVVVTRSITDAPIQFTNYRKIPS